MENMNIGLIGYGHMGKAFEKRFKEVQEKGALIDWHLQVSSSHDNTVLARNSDIVVLTVKPGHVEEALANIRGNVKKGAGLLSLAGVVPVRFLQQGFDGVVGRGMADLGFEQAIRHQGDERINFLMDALSEDTCLETGDETVVDQHTTLVACNPGISAWHFLHNAEVAAAWLREHTQLTEDILGVNPAAMERLQRKVFEEGNFAGRIKEVATVGGVTESMVLALEAARGNIACEPLYQVGMRKIEAVLQKFSA
ncbi:MAG: NAD(P)-binding domain-containing protein [Patescibacteria group bacterium]